MRGIGIGVLVTTIILVVAFAFSGNGISDEEVIARAKKLGMVESGNSTLGTTMKNATSNSTTNATIEGGNQTIPGATNPMPESTSNSNNTNQATATDDYVVFTIEGGESSRVVIERLAEQGLVSDAYAFNKYVNDRGIDNNLQNGTFKIKKGISEEELANLLVTKQQFRDGV